MPRVRRTPLALNVGAALLLAACGGPPSAAGTAARPGPPTTGTGPAAAPSGSDAGTPAAGPAGTWQTDVRPAAPVSDGQIIAGTTRQPGEPTAAVALDTGTGATMWTVSIGTAADALVSRPSLLLAPDGPLVASHQQDPGSAGGTSGSAGWQVARLDQDTGRTLWTVATAGPAASAGPDTVLVEVREGTQTAARGTVALDPADGRRLWSADSSPVLVDDGTAVLTGQADGGVSTLLLGVDATTGRALWSSSTWAGDAVGSRATALTASGGHLLVAATTTRLSDETTVLQVRDLTTGRAVGPELPAPDIPGALRDTTSGTAVVHEQEDRAGSQGVYGVDMTTGDKLWAFDADQATQADAAGGGVAWVRQADGRYTALDDRTGEVRARDLDQPPVLVLDQAQVVDDGAVLRSGPLP